MEAKNLCSFVFTTQVEAENFPPALGHPGRLDVPDRAQRGRLSAQLLWTQHVLTVWVKNKNKKSTEHVLTVWVKQ